MRSAIGRLRGWLARMTGSWRPGPEHRVEEQRVRTIEERAEKLGARRRDVLQMRLEVLETGRRGEAKTKHEP